MDALTFAANAERITNEGSVEEFMALLAPDAVADWIMDGAHDHHVGVEAIRQAALELFDVGHALNLSVRKVVECQGSDSIVLSWTGGFNGGSRQFGTEIWHFRDELVVRHQMYVYLDVRPSASPLAALRLAAASPAVVGRLLKYRVRQRIRPDRAAR